MRGRLIGGAAVGAIAALAAQYVLDLLPVKHDLRIPDKSWHTVVVALIMAATLSWFASRSSWNGWKLWAGLFGVTVGFQAVNLLESVLFGLASPAQNAYLLLHFALVMTALVAVIVWLVPAGSGRTTAEPAPLAPRTLWWWSSRIALSGLAYTAVYFIAGILAYPHVRHFYPPESTPPIGTLIATQLLIRGPLLALISAVVGRMVQGSRTMHGVAAALLLVNFGPLVLIAPNPILPASVRFVHLLEVGISNGVFGFFVGRVLSPRNRPAHVMSASPQLALRE